MILSGWGRHPKISCSVFRPKNINELKKLIKNKCIARGNGRSYGDSSLQPDGTIEMKNFNRILFFNKKKQKQFSNQFVVKLHSFLTTNI
jgi:hypothetical protein